MLIQCVEMIPSFFEQTDGVRVLARQTQTFVQVQLESEDIIDHLVPPPMLETCAIEQHYCGAVETVAAGRAHDGFSLHIASQQLRHIADRENVRVDNQCPSLESHKLRYHQA